MKDTECFEMNDIDIDKARVSDKRLYSYKHYVFYEHNDKYTPLKIILTDTVGYYFDYKDNSKYDVKYSAKRINFRLNDDSLAKVYNIFEHNEEN